MLGARDFPKKRIAVIGKNVKVQNTELKRYNVTGLKLFDKALKIHHKLE